MASSWLPLPRLVHSPLPPPQSPTLDFLHSTTQDFFKCLTKARLFMSPIFMPKTLLVNPPTHPISRLTPCSLGTRLADPYPAPCLFHTPMTLRSFSGQYSCNICSLSGFHTTLKTRLCHVPALQGWDSAWYRGGFMKSLGGGQMNE